MTLNRERAVQCAIALAAAFSAWRMIGRVTRAELRLRASCAGNALLGNPVAYRVLVVRTGDGPGIEVHGGPATVSHCTVVGTHSHAMEMDLGRGGPGTVGAHADAA